MSKTSKEIDAKEKPSLFLPYAVLLLLNLIIFWVDSQIRLGVAMGVCHAFVVFAAHHWRNRQLLNCIVFAGILFSVLGYFISPAGSDDWIVLLNRAISIASIVGVSLLCHSNRHTERALQDHSKQLAIAGEKLSASNQKLQDKYLELEQFSYMASHDLQAPLRSICGYNELLLSELETNEDDDIKRWLRSSQDVAENMQQLIHELLEYAKLDTDEVQSEAVDLNEVLRQVEGALQSSLQERQAKLSYGFLPTVLARPAEMHQVFLNLVNNGIKYCQAEQAKVEISAAPLAGNYWQINVTDNGIGIDPKFHKAIFEPFRRLQTQQKFAGNGIGLATCQKVINRHGGKIWVESDGEHGSRFCFTLSAGSEQ